MVARGCGDSRIAGGVYAECSLAPFGHPIEEFLCDPGRFVKYRELGISEIGVTPIRDVRGVVHLWDHVGRKHYPNVADFVEEARQHGISRRLPSTLPFNLLTSGSRLVLMHSRAIIRNGQDYADCEPAGRPPERCPNLIGLEHCGRMRDVHQKAQPGHACSRFWWQDVIAGNAPPTGEPIIRTIGDTTYRALSRSSGVRTDYHTGIFGIFPLTGIVVVRDREGDSDTRALQKVEAVRGVPFGIVDE